MVFLGRITRQFFRDVIVTVIVLAMVATCSAQVMTSTNYRIQSDSVNVGGGLSTSSSFRIESTAGEVATGVGTSSSYSLYAGYQQMQEVYLAVGIIGDVTMAPGLPGITGGTATGSTAVHVVTDSPAGYQMTITAATSPAMQSGANSIADYVPAGGVPDFTFITDPTDAHFGFSPEGADIVARYRDSGGVCGSGTDTASRCWEGLATSSRIIAQSAASNHPAGATTTLRFQVGIGGSAPVMEGTYIATSTVTVVPL
jgi:hypothetical protein